MIHRPPKEIKVIVMWDLYHSVPSAYSIYTEEIINICHHFETGQLNLFTFVREDVLCEWMNGIFHRQPVAVHVYQIIY